MIVGAAIGAGALLLPNITGGSGGLLLTFGGFLRTIIGALVGLSTVSYTHLDVYKRQHLY